MDQHKFSFFSRVSLWAAEWRKKHPEIARFIIYFIVCNLATIVQVVLIPLLSIVFAETNLVNIDLHLFGPIGNIEATTTVMKDGLRVTGLNPYYVFNYTAGAVNTLTHMTMNGITGDYLAHGGVASFLSMIIPLFLSQVVSFFMQRNVTFRSDGNIMIQAAWYFSAFCVITVCSNALYGLYFPWLYSKIGEGLGGLAAAFIQCCIAFWVFFPIMKLIFPEKNK